VPLRQIVATASRTVPCRIAAARSAPVSRTQRQIASATRAAGMPKRMEAPRQSYWARIAGPASAATTVPTLPPEMWALIAKPRRSLGNCSASRPFPTGCCGEPPMRETTFVTANDRNDDAAAWAANPSPKSRPPAARMGRREMRRVTKA
jgi:hypothetical protein